MNVRHKTADAGCSTAFGLTALALASLGPCSVAAQEGIGTEGARTRAFAFTPRGGVEMTATDNVLLTNTDRKGDVITSPTGGFNLLVETPRTHVSAEGDFTYDYYVATTRLNGLRANALATGSTELLNDLVTVDGHVASNLQRTSPAGQTPATDRSIGQNQVQVLTYGATPTIHWQTGNLFKTEASYDVSLVNYIRPAASVTAVPASDSVQQTVRTHVASGSAFSQTTWTIDGSIIRQDITGQNAASNRRQASASLHFPVLPNLQFVSTGGYDDIQEPSLAGRLGGANVTGGIRLRLSRRTQLSFDSGWRYGKPYSTGTLDYSFGKSLVLTATYNMSIETPQSLAAQSGASFSPTPAGSLTDPITGLPLNPTSNPFGLNNEAFRRSALDVGLSGVVGHSRYAIKGDYERRTSTLDKSISRSGSVFLGHQFSRHLDADVSLTYSRSRDTGTLLANNSDTVNAKMDLNYQVGARTNVTLGYTWQRVHGFPVRTQENVGHLALTRKF